MTLTPGPAPQGVNVAFMVELNQYQLLDEVDLKLLTEENIDVLKKRKAFEGILSLRHRPGTELRVSDELEPLVQNLCFSATPRLLGGEALEIHYFSHPGTIVLEPQGARVRLSGDMIDVGDFPRDPLAVELFTCGVRFMRWARGVKAEDASYQANLDYIDQFRQPAFEALLKAGLVDAGT